MKSKKYIEELEEIRRAHGGILRPVDVVEYAENPKTDLHRFFCWDDTEAAYRYRLWQARQLIRVVVHTIPSMSEPVRAYVSLKPDRMNGGGYRTLDSVMRNDRLREVLLVQARRDMETFIAKYETLVELADVIRAMKKTRKKLTKKKEAVKSEVVFT